jgi:hypothetical protein
VTPHCGILARLLEHHSTIRRQHITPVSLLPDCPQPDIPAWPFDLPETAFFFLKIATRRISRQYAENVSFQFFSLRAYAETRYNTLDFALRAEAA